jgi:hypothetical protein
MRADVLKIKDYTNVNDPTEFGTWVESQDPITGDIVRVWEPEVSDNPFTPTVDETEYYTIPCLARGIIEGGVRAAGTTEDWADIYSSIELVRLFFPAGYILTRRDRVINIRSQNGQIIWKEEDYGESSPGSGIYQATVFDVLGVTPVIDPFGTHIENYALLERAEVQ